jgi:REP element-mobilizing transposase RayT
MPFFDPFREIEISGTRLPHWQQDSVPVFVTWRLADSVPAAKLDEWNYERECWLKAHGDTDSAQVREEYRRRFMRSMHDWLDRGHGQCLLRVPESRKVLVEALHFFDQERYELQAYVVMPNHVHVLFRPATGQRIGDIVRSWKRHSSRETNRRLGRTGTPLWQFDYFDRLVRDSDHERRVIRYIEGNPVGLAEEEFDLWVKA